MPLALVDNGVRWHVRAFDRLRNHFTDFVPTRMEDVEVLETSPVGREERADQDVQWSRIIELKLVPHPNHPRPEIVQMDYPMKTACLRSEFAQPTLATCSEDGTLTALPTIASKVLSTRFGFKIRCPSTDPQHPDNRAGLRASAEARKVTQ